MDKKVFLIELGKRIKTVREKRKISQADLAMLCEKDRQSISKLESGKVNPSAYYLYEVASALKIPYGKLIDIKG